MNPNLIFLFVGLAVAVVIIALLLTRFLNRKNRAIDKEIKNDGADGVGIFVRSRSRSQSDRVTVAGHETGELLFVYDVTFRYKDTSGVVQETTTGYVLSDIQAEVLQRLRAFPIRFAGDKVQISRDVYRAHDKLNKKKFISSPSSSAYRSAEVVHPFFTQQEIESHVKETRQRKS